MHTHTRIQNRGKASNARSFDHRFECSMIIEFLSRSAAKRALRLNAQMLSPGLLI